MTKREQFKTELYSIASECLAHEQEDKINTTYTGYILNTLTERTEKMFINELIPRLERNIKTDSKLGIEQKYIDIQNKELQICNDRLKIITANEVEFKQFLKEV